MFDFIPFELTIKEHKETPVTDYATLFPDVMFGINIGQPSIDHDYAYRNYNKLLEYGRGYSSERAHELCNNKWEADKEFILRCIIRCWKDSVGVLHYLFTLSIIPVLVTIGVKVAVWSWDD